MDEKRFYFALSFPDENRDFALALAEKLAEVVTRDRVFYDKWYEAELIGPSGDLELLACYNNSYIVIPLFSKHYQKPWCRWEWDGFRGALEEWRRKRRLIPIRLDDTPIPGWNRVDFEIRLEGRKAKEIAKLIVEAFRKRCPELGIAASDARLPAKPNRKDESPLWAWGPLIIGAISVLIIVSFIWRHGPWIAAPLVQLFSSRGGFNARFDVILHNKPALGLLTISALEGPAGWTRSTIRKEPGEWVVGIEKEGKYRFQCWSAFRVAAPLVNQVQGINNNPDPDAFARDEKVAQTSGVIRVEFTDKDQIPQTQ